MRLCTFSRRPYRLSAYGSPPMFPYLRSFIVYEVPIYRAAAAAFERDPYPCKGIVGLRRSKLFEFFDILRILIRDVNGKTCAAAFYALNVFLCVCAGCPLPHFSYPSQLLSKTGISLPHFLQRAFNASLSFSGSRYNLENTPHLISPSANTSKSCEAQQVSVPFISSLPSLFFRHDTSKNGRIFSGIKSFPPRLNGFL